jgi:hypothetical protein
MGGTLRWRAQPRKRKYANAAGNDKIALVDDLESINPWRPRDYLTQRNAGPGGMFGVYMRITPTTSWVGYREASLLRGFSVHKQSTDRRSLFRDGRRTKDERRMFASPALDTEPGPEPANGKLPLSMAVNVTISHVTLLKKYGEIK